MAVSDAEMLKIYGEILSRYPNLKKILPENYPQANKFQITCEQMKSYSSARENQYWHHMNLPLAIHSVTDPNKIASDFGNSILRILDDFTARFEKLLGTKTTLAPLWDPKATFNYENGPQFWSIIACALLALKYQRNGFEILGFEQKIGVGGKDADILAKKGDGTNVHVDVEMWHRATFDDLSIADIQEELGRRADKKIGNKYADLPEGEIGVAAVVCASRSLSFELLQKHPCLGGLINLGSERPRRYGYVYWLAVVNDGQARHVDILDKPIVS